jgi:hypothetical protein
MEEVTQILVGGHRTGIIGLKEALDEAKARCEGLSDEEKLKNWIQKAVDKNNV